MAISKGLDAEKVAAGLIMGAVHQDGHVRAAVNLLVETGWHRIPAFRKVLLEINSQGDAYAVGWNIARKAFDNNEFAGTGGDCAEQVLDFALALGSNQYGLSRQNDVTAGGMIAALACALGATRVEYRF